jgi:hypothetical protein
MGEEGQGQETRRQVRARVSSDLSQPSEKWERCGVSWTFFTKVTRQFFSSPLLSMYGLIDFPQFRDRDSTTDSSVLFSTA